MSSKCWWLSLIYWKTPSRTRDNMQHFTLCLGEWLTIRHCKDQMVMKCYFERRICQWVDVNWINLVKDCKKWRYVVWKVIKFPALLNSGNIVRKMCKMLDLVVYNVTVVFRWLRRTKTLPLTLLQNQCCSQYVWWFDSGIYAVVPSAFSLVWKNVCIRIMLYHISTHPRRRRPVWKHRDSLAHARQR